MYVNRSSIYIVHIQVNKKLGNVKGNNRDSIKKERRQNWDTDRLCYINVTLINVYTCYYDTGEGELNTGSVEVRVHSKCPD